MVFDRKWFGACLKQAIIMKHGTLTVAVEKLRKAGLDGFTNERMSEYISGMKVPTLERFAIMVRVLGLDTDGIFPKFVKPGETKVRAVRHPSEARMSARGISLTELDTD